MSLVGRVHSSLVANRRSRILARHLSEFVPPGGRVLDVGCGDGLIDRIIMGQTGAAIEGIDTLLRPETHIPVRVFDGLTLPCSGRSFDLVMFVDVLHHTQHPQILLAEAARVGKGVLIKDHFRDGFLAQPTLRLMDWFGNAHHGIALPHNYLSEVEWNHAFAGANLQLKEMKRNLGLYPGPFSWIFERDFHFIALCVPLAE